MNLEDTIRRFWWWICIVGLVIAYTITRLVGGPQQ